MKSLLLTLLISFLSGSIFSQNVLTIGEVFDFKIDDEFHYRNHVFSSTYPSGRTVKVIDKWFSSNLDTVNYEIEVTEFYTTFNFVDLDWHLSPMEIKSISFTNLNLPITDYDSGFGQDTLRTYIDSNNILVNYFWYHIGTFEPDTYWGYYGAGIGTVDYGRAIPSNADVKGEELVYYNKGTKVWGNPWLFPTSVDELETQNSIHVYPNPFSNSITISTLKTDQISIYNMLGNLILTQNKIEDETTIDVSKLTVGTYIVEFESNGEYTRKVLVKD